MVKHDFHLLEMAQIAAARSGKTEKISSKEEAIKSLKDFLNFKSEVEKDVYLKSVCRFFLEIEKIKQPEYRVTRLARKLRNTVREGAGQGH
jgi:hypothetical protein